MTPEPPSPPLDLLVVGGLTVDRFADGTAAPGGSVLHVARAAKPRGLHLGVVTASGPEAVARRGVDELRRTCDLVEVADAASTITFRHRGTDGDRRLWLEESGHAVALPADAHARIVTRTVLYAPVADELNVAALRVWSDTWDRGAILQGWLRDVDPSMEVRPRSLASLPADLRAALSDLDLLVASRQDLRADGDDPERQLRAMRRTFGDRALLVVTDAGNGAWIAWGRHARRVAVPRLVEGASSVGAGDIFAAFLLARGKAHLPESVIRNVEEAMGVVAQVLEERRQA